MKKQDSWESQFRKKRFYEKRELKEDMECEFMLLPQAPKTIAVMLDLEGTTDFIDDEKAKIFIKQLEFIRRKFNAQYGTISISTHCINSRKVKDTLEIFARNLTKNIKIGTSFYFGGTYDFDDDKDTVKDSYFNLNKVSTFDSYYVSSFGVDNQWFAVVDDNISEDVYKKYQDKHPMFVCRPSQYSSELSKNCFMSIATTTEGFDGVIESFNIYIESIKNLSSLKILETQRNMMMHLSSYELIDKIKNKNYIFVEKYFRGGYADDNDYKDVLTWLNMMLYIFDKEPIMKNELVQLQHILEIIAKRFKETNDEKNIELVNKLQKDFKNHC